MAIHPQRHLITTVLLAAAAVSGCNFNSYVYRPDVHQGNMVTSEMVAQLAVGMSRHQVLFLLGEPLIRSDFHKDRWDYPYYINPRRGDIQLRHVTVFFDENDKLKSIEHEPLPNEKEADELVMGIRSTFGDNAKK